MMSNNPGIISLYITKNIFKVFFALFFGLFLLFFAVDFFETTKDLDKNIPNALKISILIVLYRTPSIIESILHFIILLSGLFVFFKLSNNSEIVVMRSSGKSLFQIIKFPMIMIFFFGVFIITVYNPIASTLNMKSQQMDNIHFRNEKEDLLELNNGIWFKQKNLEDGGTIVIKASKVYKNILVFSDVILLYIDDNNNFIKRINTQNIKLNDGEWITADNYVIEEGKKIEYVDLLKIPTTLTKKFVSKTIQNDYESLYNVSFWKLRNSIKDLKESGFDTLRFEVRYYYLMTVPFLFAIMIFISAYFGIVSIRSNKKYISIIKGIAVGFIIFLSHNIIVELTNARRLTIMDGSVLIVLIYIFISITLLLKKDLLSNFNAKIFKKGN